MNTKIIGLLILLSLAKLNFLYSQNGRHYGVASFEANKTLYIIEAPISLEQYEKKGYNTKSVESHDYIEKKLKESFKYKLLSQAKINPEKFLSPIIVDFWGPRYENGNTVDEPYEYFWNYTDAKNWMAVLIQASQEHDTKYKIVWIK
ncbi:MAG: hypothetical protein QM763_16495 [Agriterribacter sp.]